MRILRARCGPLSEFDRPSSRCGNVLQPLNGALDIVDRQDQQVTSRATGRLLFADVERLLAICRRPPFQVVIAGKAHPRDGSGKALIHTIHWQHMMRRYASEAYLR